MKITAETTVDQLQLGLLKLGVHSRSWTTSGGKDAITLMTDEHRVMMFGESFIEAMSKAVTELENRIAADAIMFQHRTNPERR